MSYPIHDLLPKVFNCLLCNWHTYSAIGKQSHLEWHKRIKK